jgi:Cu/Ag efflux pump CusA
VLRWPKTVIFLALAIVVSTVPVYLKLGSEFMPPLNEGTILYMPTTLPGISVTEAQRLMETPDRKALARYGLTIDDLQCVIMTAIGGEDITTTVEGRERPKVVIPVTILLIFLLLYMNTRSAFKATVVILAVPFSVVGAVWLMVLLGYNISIAAWVGMIALMGLDAETGVFMLLFLDLSYADAKRQGLLRNLADLKEAIIHGAVKRVRPKMMTVAAASMGLMPIMWSAGTGADLMKRVAAPMVGGLFTSFLMELLVYPAIYLLWRSPLVKPEPDTPLEDKPDHPSENSTA